jgi:hypothetical protein
MWQQERRHSSASVAQQTAAAAVYHRQQLQKLQRAPVQAISVISLVALPLIQAARRFEILAEYTWKPIVTKFL